MRAGGCTAAAHSGHGDGISPPERRLAAPDTYLVWQAVQTETGASVTECGHLELYIVRMSVTIFKACPTTKYTVKAHQRVL